MQPNQQVLRDASGRRIGEIETNSDGDQILREPNGKRLGEYRANQNVTRYPNGRRVGEGNLLAGLLHR